MYVLLFIGFRKANLFLPKRVPVVKRGTYPINEILGLLDHSLTKKFLEVTGIGRIILFSMFSPGCKKS
jgi:hypothetical protein